MLRFICIMVDSSISTFWFQYIPCYGLSFFRKETYVSCKNFNTSHVTVYLSFFLLYAVRTNISIHPMLRFISNGKRRYMCQSLFQYIPCYGLSKPVIFGYDEIQKFQYIPCYGLSILVTIKISLSNWISIHPMLRFIISAEMQITHR